ncbi:unnamed protein product [Nesidiocoris tenuis]|uniref:Uncharacterized protein n=1 Tax=Nesidiocoris tenuis TaxID=355587 RepID=A0A6H5HJD0_9HEMI|nr:unnamed protein product [Nesidiocoris tenuis]
MFGELNSNFLLNFYQSNENMKLLPNCFSVKVRHKDERCSICHNGHMRPLHCRNGGTNSRKASDKATTVVQIPKSAAKRRDFGSSRVPMIPDNIYQAEYYDNDEVITDQWEPSSPVQSLPTTSEAVPTYSTSSGGSLGKKYRKRPRNEDDQDWSIDQEYVPVNKRGRPKGTKNRPKTVSIIERTCILCEWLGADTDMLAHTINIHCQPDLDFFPCPMCKTCHPNEIELETHIEEHIKLARSE